jgi:tetratricopeptide (TPR) repeat protein
LKSTGKDKQELINLCKNEYKGNKTQLGILREFEKDYSPDRALWWYTRESFLYKMLNKSLRVQNIDIMFLFRSFMNDIYQQLKQHQCKSPTRVYRAQMMSNDEVNKLRQSIGSFISINSFFSTSTNRHEALVFLYSSGSSNDLNQVLFVIDANPRVVTTKPFADISVYSEHKDESEVLFMIGCVFQLINIYQDDNQVWIIEMKLCGDDEHDMKNLFEHMKREYGGGQGEITLRIFGDVLRKMGKYDLAEKMYCRLLNETPPNTPSVSDIYWSLGIVTHEKGDYDSSLEWFHKTLKLKIQANPSDYISIGNLYNWIGECYRLKNDYSQALEWYSKAIELYKIHQHNDSNMAHFYNNSAFIYNAQEKYKETLDFNEKALTIREKHLPPNHPDIARSHHCIGNAQYGLSHYDLALEHYNRSLEIQLKSLPPQHPHIAMIYAAIGNVHEAKNKLSAALAYYQNAAAIYRQSYSSQNPFVIRNEQNIQRVTSKMK